MPANPYTDPEKRHDFVLVFDVTDGNPNGDPDAGNLPRTDPETMQGLVTDVSLKRKVRNFVALVADDEEEERRSALNIYVEHKGVALNAQHRKAYRALGIPTTEPKEEAVTDSEVLEALRSMELPEGFVLVEPQAEDGGYKLSYSGGLSEENRKVAVEAIGIGGAKAKKFAEKVSKGAKTVKATRPQVDSSRDWMCQHFYDVRMFGAVMSTEINAGQVRGPMQLTFARSVDPILPQDVAITRVAITREAEREQKETEIGRKTLIPYGLYVGYGFYSPYLAKDTGVVEADLKLFWDALVNMWTFDRSASRGMMAPRALYVFTHDKKLGNAPAHKLFDLVRPELKEKDKSPRKFSDYEVHIDREAIPEGVTLTALVE